jgi:hypothetical protein
MRFNRCLSASQNSTSMMFINLNAQSIISYINNHKRFWILKKRIMLISVYYSIWSHRFFPFGQVIQLLCQQDILKHQCKLYKTNLPYFCFCSKHWAFQIKPLEAWTYVAVPTRTIKYGGGILRKTNIKDCALTKTDYHC